MRLSVVGSAMLFYIVMLLTAPFTTKAFHPVAHVFRRHTQPYQQSTNGESLGRSTCLLLAKKARKGSADQRNSNGGNSGAKSGFGASSTDSAGLSSKLRSVSSQHAGAGSKTLRKAANLFDAIQKAHGKESCHDVYIRSPLNSATTYWFAGKVAVDPTSIAATATAACLSQKRLILEYAKTNLRPQNLGGRYAASLELWLAPGDSEMDVVTNKVNLERVSGSALDLPENFDVNAVGFNPEIYVGDEVTKGGLRVERDEEGRPTKPVFEVNESM